MFAKRVKIFNTFAALANSFFPMKTKLILLFFFSLVFSFAQAQTARGTWLVDGSAGMARNLTPGGDNWSAGIAPRIGYFLTENFMLEVELQYSYGRSAPSDLNFETQSRAIVPGTRFYISLPSETLAPFLEVRGGYRHIRNQFSDLATNSEQWFWNPSVGLDYFLNPNIALEAMIGYRGSYFDNTVQDAHSLLLAAGLQLFLTQNATYDTPLQNPIRRGNWLIGGNLNSGLQNIGNTNDLVFSLSPVVGYFFTDRLAAGSGFQLAFANENAIVHPEPFVRYYPVGGASVWQPFATAGFGTRFQLADKFSEASFFGLNAVTGIGLDVFIAPNIALEGILRYDIRQIEEAVSPETLRLLFGFQVFL